MIPALRAPVFGEKAYGLRLHFLDIALDDLHSATSLRDDKSVSELTTEQLVLALLPCFEALIIIRDKAVFARTMERVVASLVDNYELGTHLAAEEAESHHNGASLPARWPALLDRTVR